MKRLNTVSIRRLELKAKMNEKRIAMNTLHAEIIKIREELNALNKTRMNFKSLSNLKNVNKAKTSSQKTK